MHPMGTLLSLRVRESLWLGEPPRGGFTWVQRDPGPHWCLHGGFGASAGVSSLGKAGSCSPGSGRAAVKLDPAKGSEGSQGC